MIQDKKQSSIAFVIGASSVGTLIEWYDFYIFGMLATIISKQFFPADAGTAALLSTWPYLQPVLLFDLLGHWFLED